MPSRFILIVLAALAVCPAARADTAAPPEGLVLEIGSMVVSIPRLTVEGGTLTGAELARLADPKDKTPLDERLARVTAKRIVIPEIRGESNAGERVTRIIYKDVVLEDVANGRVGALRAASLEQSAKGAGAAVEAHYTKLSAKGVDPRQLAHVLAVARGDKEEAKTIEEEAAIESVSLAFPDAGLEIHAGPVSAQGLRARALAEPPLAATRDGAATPEQGAMLALTSLGAMELGAFSARDVVMTGRGAPGEKPYAVKFGRLTLEQGRGRESARGRDRGFRAGQRRRRPCRAAPPRPSRARFQHAADAGRGADLAARPRRGGGRRRRSARRRRRWARQIRDWRA